LSSAAQLTPKRQINSGNSPEIPPRHVEWKFIATVAALREIQHRYFDPLPTYEGAQALGCDAGAHSEGR
jgi:hypothetical protein